ncbi:MAG TPA: glycosyltransferase [Pirellulales bacterium]|nr:glycosyltransferase [Pirellulales bacterium]
MKTSLSALVPVTNSQSTVGPLVSQLLEVMSELTDRFELLVIDNGSTDATAEVIADLALLYPQLSQVVLAAPADRATLMRQGMLRSSGDVVLYRSETCAGGPGALNLLWHALRLGDVAIARRGGPALLGAIPPLPSEGPVTEPDWHMARRCVLDGWLRTQSSRDWADFLAARGFAVQEIDSRWIGPRPSWRSGVSVQLPAAHVQRRDSAASQATRPTRRPNYLDRLKAFALGE